MNQIRIFFTRQIDRITNGLVNVLVPMVKSQAKESLYLIGYTMFEQKIPVCHDE